MFSSFCIRSIPWTFIRISNERMQRIMTFNEVLLLFFESFEYPRFHKKFKDFGPKNSRCSSSKTVLWKKCNSVIGTQRVHAIFIRSSHRSVYSLKNGEIYEKGFWVRTDYVLFRLYSSEKRDNSTTMLDSFYC